jgi:O-antigen/teichoic acid export membrane protein
MSATGPSLHLTSGRLLARNTIWNLLGQLLPMAVGVLAVPPLVRGLGVPRFGILSLAWIVIGYFSLFDLGIGRALTKLVADKMGANQQASIPPLVWTSLLLMLLLGVLGGLIALSVSPWLVHHALKVPLEFQAETMQGFELLALSIPLITVTAGLRGVLEAQQRFRILTLIRIPMNLFSFVGPLLVLPFSHSLVVVVVVLIAGRFLGCVAHLLACFHAMPALRNEFSLERSVIQPVISYGGWMTVANLVGPIMVYMDRFLISALLSVGVVAYYTAPFDVVMRLSVIPGGFVGVLFPAFAVSLAQNRERTALLISRGIKYIVLVLFPVILVIVTAAPEGLRLWLGPTFAQNGTAVLRWLAVGVFVNSVAYVPFVLIQSTGRPDLTAKVQVAEVPLYLAALWWLTAHFGIEGAAIAWTGRVIVDTTVLFICAERLLPHKPKLLLKLGITMAAALTVLGLASIPESLFMKAVFLGTGLLVFAAAAWRWALGSSERVFLAGTRTEKTVQVRLN